MTDHRGSDPTEREPGRRLSRVALALVVAGCVAGAGAAAAASGVLSVGDVISAGEPSTPPEHELSVDETVLATGSTPVAGPWRMTTHQSEQSGGQPAGLPCIRLVLTDPPKGTPLGGSGFCGEVGQGFGAVSLPVVTDSGEAELLILGQAPEGAAAVRLTSADGATVRVATREGGAAYEGGDVFVMIVPPGMDQGELTYLDQDGTAGSKSIDASGFFDRLQAVQKGGAQD